MSKIYVRVDDRLIHGQTIVAWCPTLGIKEIVAIDDESASNPLLKSILTMGVPKDYKTRIVTHAQAKSWLVQPHSLTSLVLVKRIADLVELQAELTGCEEIVLGNLAKREDCVHQLSGATGIFYLSEQDVLDLTALQAAGFRFVFQQLPTTSKKTWEDVQRSL